MIQSINEIEIDQTIALSKPYIDVVQALRTLEANNLFPLKTSGNITLHYNKQGDLTKVVPSLYIDMV